MPVKNKKPKITLPEAIVLNVGPKDQVTTFASFVTIILFVILSIFLLPIPEIQTNWHSDFDSPEIGIVSQHGNFVNHGRGFDEHDQSNKNQGTLQNSKEMSKRDIEELLSEDDEGIISDSATDEDGHDESHDNFQGNIFEKIIHIKHKHGKLKINYAEDGFPETNGFCPFEPVSETRLEEIEPKYNLRRDHYLINLSPFGPNNQFRGLRDTVMLAYYLNRTVVIPPFFKHTSDPSFNSFTYRKNCQRGVEKIDVEKLATWIPVMTFEEYAKRCHAGIDMAMYARSEIPHGTFINLHAYEQMLNISIYHNQTDEELGKNFNIGTKYNILPKKDFTNEFKVMRSPYGVMYQQLYLNMKEHGINAAYGETKYPNAPCAFWVLPFRNLYWNRAILYGQGDKNAGELAKEMVVHTSRPPHISEFARKFAQRVMHGMPYIAMHWRYDKKDFGVHCGREQVPGNALACKYLKSVKWDSETIAVRIVDWMKRLRSENPKAYKIKFFYLAVPPKEKKFLKVFKQYMENDLGLKIYSAEDVVPLIEDQFDKCPLGTFENQIHDFISQLEQEICMLSTVFFPSDGSSWSQVIQADRMARSTHENDIENRIFFEPADKKDVINQYHTT